ncbi:MAG: hypothetical protein RSH78_04015 [Bacilli bacterium]
MPKSNKIIILVIAFIAITFITINEIRMRPKLNLVNDAKKIKEIIKKTNKQNKEEQIIINNQYKIENKKYKIKGTGVIFLEENYSFFIGRNNMCAMKMTYSNDIMFQNKPCPTYRMFNSIKLPIKEKGDGLYKDLSFKGKDPDNYVILNDKLFRILNFKNGNMNLVSTYYSDKIDLEDYNKENIIKIEKLNLSDFETTKYKNTSFISKEFDENKIYTVITLKNVKKIRGNGEINDPFILNI